MEKRELVIIGAGPAGMSAAIYGKRAGLDVLVLEKAATGGQINNTDEIENYPGISHVSGAELESEAIIVATSAHSNTWLSETEIPRRMSSNTSKEMGLGLLSRYHVFIHDNSHISSAVIISATKKSYTVKHLEHAKIILFYFHYPFTFYLRLNV